MSYRATDQTQARPSLVNDHALTMPHNYATVRHKINRIGCDLVDADRALAGSYGADERAGLPDGRSRQTCGFWFVRALAREGRQLASAGR